MNILCRLGWHSWEEHKSGRLGLAMPPMPIEYATEICTRCGLKKHITLLNGSRFFERIIKEEQNQ